jgi:hypothetical protein
LQAIEPFYCSFEALPKIIGALRLFGELTEKARRLQPGEPLEIVLPYRATKVRTGYDLHTKQIVAQFQTTEGIPVMIAMPPTLAEEKIRLLQGELDRMKSAHDP